MRKILIFAGLAVVLVAVALLSRFNTGEKTREVEVQPAELKLIRSSILASGSLAYREQVQLRSEVIGQVTALHVEEAARVKKGDLVISLDPKSYQAQVDQAEAHVRIQEIAIERQKLLLQNLEERFARQKQLYSSNLVDKDSFERLENELSLAGVDLRSLQESLSQARAALEQAAELLDKTQIKSPIDGIVIQIDVKVGETVIAGTTNIPGSTMMVIADPSATLTEVNVDEADIATVREQQKADVYAAAYPDKPLSGTVESIASVARQPEGQQSLSFLVKILLDEQEALVIRPGMSVRADIYTETSDATLAIPVQAVLFDEESSGEESSKGTAPNIEQAYVFVMQDGKARRRNVKTGISSDSDQEILDGLKQGDQVITGPFRTLRALVEDDSVAQITHANAKAKAKDDDEDEEVEVVID